VQEKTKIKIGSNRSFGIVFSIVFFIVGLFPLINNLDIRIWAIIIALFFLILGSINSNLLKPLNILWFKFGLLLGKIISPIIMGLVFFAVVTPTGFLVKIFGKDLLNLKNKKNIDSHWIIRDKTKVSLKKQF